MRVMPWSCVLAVVPALTMCLLGQAANPSRSAVDQRITTYLQQKFSSNKDLRGVQPSVQNRIVTLTGTVPSYAAELDAEHDAKSAPDSNGFVDNLQISGPTVSDEQLEKEIAEKLVYARQFMGQTFDAFTVQVHNGVVTLGGAVINYPDRSDALALVDQTKGVRGVQDDVKVEPLSPMDNQIRLEAMRRIYGNPELQRYAINPARPIRIIVDNGHVTLVGVVQTNVDKQTAGDAVESLPGVFSVKNDLIVDSSGK